jgi:hypothetical protein
MTIDFLARQSYFIHHLAPIWNTINPADRGTFYILDHCEEEARKKLKDPLLEIYTDDGDCGSNPIVTAAYGDAVRAYDWDHGRPVILCEHGVGLTFGKAAYADGLGQRVNFSLFPVQSEYVLSKVHPDLKHKPHPVVGVPKMDIFAGEFQKPHPMPRLPTIGLAFHHGDKFSRPGVVGSAWEHYAEKLPELAKRYKVLMHAHPTAAGGLHDVYKNMQALGAEFVPEFETMMRRADILINDTGSASYEFIVTGKPVILLNAPWFDRKEKYGLRFWDYADIGPQIDDPYFLIKVIDETIEHPDATRPYRSKAVSDLFPYLGESSIHMVDAILNHTHKVIKLQPRVVPASQTLQPVSIVKPHRPKIKLRTSKERGVLYMCFGEAAILEMGKSIQSLRAVGSSLPIAVVGDMASLKNLNGLESEILETIEWTGENPFDPTKAEHFHFRAGRVKPGFYDATPFKETLYLDCDTEIKKDVELGFEFLKRWDFVIAQERLNINQLYNRPRAGWQHNIIERDATIEELGGNGDIPFWNSGVFFWRHCQAAESMFAAWSEEWRRWQQWDEQLSLIRAGHRSRARILVLSERWNYPHDDDPEAVIVHLYGKGAARTDVK